MLTNEERVRALLNNIHSWSWDIYPTIPLQREDAKALWEFLKDNESMNGVYVGKEN